MSSFCVAIPARYGSTRLPGKPLRQLDGRPMLEHAFRQAVASGAEEVIIATDDERIREAAKGFGASVYMTATTHSSGTDRLAEVVERRGWPDDTVIVNLQGDEPLMPPALLRQVAAGLATHGDAGIATLCTPIHTLDEVFNPHVVKVVLNAQGYALYFSRAPIPYDRAAFAESQNGSTSSSPVCGYFRHIGLYAYRAAQLRRFPDLSACPLEQTEALEQLRALWHGIPIYVQEAQSIPPPGVDTEADLARLQAYFSQGQ